MSLQISVFGDRTICYGGIGKMFYQEGFPVSMAVAELKKHNCEVSLFHVADECLKNGWSAQTTIRKLSDDFSDDKHIPFDKHGLTTFCNATYQDQREMIFNYLFQASSDEAIRERELREIAMKKVAIALAFNERMK